VTDFASFGENGLVRLELAREGDLGTVCGLLSAANRTELPIWSSSLRSRSGEECNSTGDLLFMEGDGPLCLECADLDQLVYLAFGDGTLTRRAKSASGLAAVVVRFSRSRRRYERQGILVKGEALAQAEAACLGDEEARARRQFRQAKYRSVEDDALKDSLGQEIIRLFPGCPREKAEDIAAHAGTTASGRVGRSAAGRALDADAVTSPSWPRCGTVRPPMTNSSCPESHAPRPALECGPTFKPFSMLGALLRAQLIDPETTPPTADIEIQFHGFPRRPHCQIPPHSRWHRPHLSRPPTWRWGTFRRQ
jgi:hypothetical protein